MTSYDLINNHAAYVEFCTGVKLSKLTIAIHTQLYIDSNKEGK